MHKCSTNFLDYKTDLHFEGGNMMIKFCPKCKSKNIWKRGFRKNKNSKKQKYHCKRCNNWFIEDDGFKRMRNDKKILSEQFICIMMYCLCFKCNIILNNTMELKLQDKQEILCRKFSVFLK